MTVTEFDDFFNNKIKENEYFLKFTYYELRVKHNLSQDETDEFVDYAERKLKKMGYDVYLTGDPYTFPNTPRVVETNELLVAIKKVS